MKLSSFKKSRFTFVSNVARFRPINHRGTRKLRFLVHGRLVDPPFHARLIYLVCFRGDGEIRTLDPLLARQVLSQLSYTPTASPQTPLSFAPS